MASSRRKRGYTIVELMMALAIFSIGITGIAAMETMAAAGNMHAKNMAVATALARSWQDKLAMDGLSWGGTSNWPLANTRWLQQANGINNQWFLPAGDGSFGPGAGALGQFVDETANPQDIVFCTHIRLTQLITAPGSGALRTEVRVFWPKGSTSWNGGANYCTAGAVAPVGAAANEFYFVHKTSAVRETPAF